MLLNTVYGLFLVLGGSIGYVKKGSLISFLAGGSSGFMMIYNTDDKFISAITSGSLFLLFGYRYIIGQKPMAAFISVFSASIAVANSVFY